MIKNEALKHIKPCMLIDCAQILQDYCNAGQQNDGEGCLFASPDEDGNNCQECLLKGWPSDWYVSIARDNLEESK